MTTLSCTILPERLDQVHELLTCLAKFDENVSLEASKDQVSPRLLLDFNVS